MTDPSSARRATSLIFLICGTATSSWAPMVPFAKSHLSLDEATLGLILLVFGGGSVVAMPLAGLAIHYWGSRPLILGAVVVASAALPLLAIHATPLMLAGTLFTFGAALGTMDVAMNAQAIAVQQALGRPVMSAFHAMFSVGGLVGAACVSALLRAGVPLTACAAIIAAVLLVLGLFESPRLLRGTSSGSHTSFTLVAAPRVVLLGVLCFISFLAEGAVLDWSAVFLRELRGVNIAAAGIGYAVFSIAMVAVRLAGDRLTHRFGPAQVLRAGAAIAAAGFLLAAFVPSTAACLAGFALIGIGAANIVPVLFSATGHVPGVAPGVALAAVTTIAYAGLLLGPALIGFIADLTSLPIAFAVVAAMLAGIAFAGKRVQ